MNVAYIRVSTVEQNEARQLEAMKDKGIEKYFTEKVSAKNTNRPELQAMLDYVREGDTVYVHDFSRLARSTKDLLEIVEYLNNKGVHLVSNKEKLDTSTAAGRMMLTMLSAIYQFERENLLERQREGIAIAKEEGKYAGRKAIERNEELWQQHYERYLKRKINKVQFAKEMNVSRPTLDKWLKEAEKEGNVA